MSLFDDVHVLIGDQSIAIHMFFVIQNDHLIIWLSVVGQFITRAAFRLDQPFRIWFDIVGQRVFMNDVLAGGFRID